MPRLVLYFGNAQVGILSSDFAQCCGIGLTIYARGIESLADGVHYAGTDPRIIAVAEREFAGTYFRSEIVNG